MRKLILTPLILILCWELQSALELREIKAAQKAKIEAKKKDNAPKHCPSNNNLNNKK